MRTLATEVEGIPAGTEYEIYAVTPGAALGPFNPQIYLGLIRARWIIAKLSYGGNVHNMQPGAPLARALYAAHLAAMGISDADEAPCGNCSSVIRAGLTICPECGADPDADVPCPDCQDSSGVPLGYISVSRLPGGFDSYESACPTCEGERNVEAPNAGQREAAIKAAREWRRSQSMEANPVPAGIGDRAPGSQHWRGCEAAYGDGACTCGATPGEPRMAVIL